MSPTIDTTSQSHTSTEMDQYKTKEDVLKLGIVDPELEEASDPQCFREYHLIIKIGSSAQPTPFNRLFITDRGTAPISVSNGEDSIRFLSKIRHPGNRARYHNA